MEHAFPEDTTSELRQTVVPNRLRARPFKAFSDRECKSIITLRKDKNKIILPADKG